MKTSLKITLCLVTIALLHININAQITDQITTDPEEALFVYGDVKNFISAFEMLGPDSDTIDVLQKEYIDRGTEGLKMFIEKYNLSAAKLTMASN